MLPRRDTVKLLKQMPRKRAINQQEIADRLQISRTTVSRCFTNHAGINPETRAAVFSLAAQMGYHYLESRTGKAAEKAKGAKNTIAVLICRNVEEYNRPDHESPGMELMPGISEFALLKKLQLDVQFVPPEEKSLDGPTYRRLLQQRSRMWGGMVLLFPFPPEVIGQLAARFACVSLVEQFDSAAIDCVDVDHYKGISQLIDRLVELGHRRIGFYSRHYQVEACWAFRRYSAYVEKMTRLGLPVRLEDIVSVRPGEDQTVAQAEERACRMTRDGVTAWVCAADHQAYDLVAALQKRGVSVPRQVSVSGFDGVPQPANAPLLTTIQMPYRQIGLIGARRLHDLMEKRFDVPQHIFLEGRLCIGATMAPAPGA